jgi:hypothetical protein
MKYKSVPFKKDAPYPRDLLVSTLKEFRTEHVTFTVVDDNVRLSEVVSELPEEASVPPPAIVDEPPNPPKKVGISSGGLKVAMASIFRMKGKPVLSEMEIVNTMAFDTKWVGPTRAKDIIFTAKEMNILKEIAEGLELGFDIDTIPENTLGIPFDFLKKDSPAKEEPKPVTDLQKVEKQHIEPALPVEESKPKKVLPAWSKVKLHNDKCLKHCKNRTKACDDCHRWGNFKE